MAFSNRLTPNLFQLSLEDFNETVFTGCFIFVDILCETNILIVLSDGQTTQQLDYNKKLILNIEKLVKNQAYKVSFHHSFKTQNGLLMINRMTLMEEATPAKSNEQTINLMNKVDDLNTSKLNQIEPINHTDMLSEKRATLENERSIKINDLRLDLQDWNFVATLNEKSDLKKYSKSNDYFFDVHVGDCTGSIRIIFWKDTSGVFFDKLNEGVSYLFKNFDIKNESKYTKTAIKLELYANLKSQIEVVDLENSLKGEESRKLIKVN